MPWCPALRRRSDHLDPWRCAIHRWDGDIEPLKMLILTATNRDFRGCSWINPLIVEEFATETMDHVCMFNLLNMVIFHIYVRLPKRIWNSSNLQKLLKVGKLEKIIEQPWKHNWQHAFGVCCHGIHIFILPSHETWSWPCFASATCHWTVKGRSTDLCSGGVPSRTPNKAIGWSC